MTATCTAFAGSRHLASGDHAAVATAVKAALDAGEAQGLLIFDDATARTVEMDFRGSLAEVLARLPAAEVEPPRGRGRPKLGVTAREVTLLPRHWDWLAGQPGGASVTLRKLVEAARRAGEAPDRIRKAQEAAYRFVSVMAGDLPGYEEALRALYLKDQAGFEARLEAWPKDVAAHASRLAAPVFAPSEAG